MTTTRLTVPQDHDHDDHPTPDLTHSSRADRIEQLLRRAVERGGYMTNADLIGAREVLGGRRQQAVALKPDEIR